MSVKQQPFLYLFIVWISGIALAAGYFINVRGWTIAVFGLLVLCGVIWSAHLRGFIAVKKLLEIIGILLLLSISALFYQWIDWNNRSEIDEWLPYAAEAGAFKAEATGEMISAIKVDGDRASFQLALDRLKWNDQWIGINKEKVQVTVRLMKKEEWEAIQTWKRGRHIQASFSWERPDAMRNPGGFNYRAYLHRQHIHWIATVRGLDTIKGTSGFHWLTWTDSIRLFLEQKLEALFPPETSGFFKGLLLGVQDELNPKMFERFSILGLTHVLAISGLHVGLVVAGLLWFFRKIGFTRERAILVTISLLPFYILLTGASPSAIRAGLMALMGLFALRYGQWKNSLNLLGFTGWVMLLWNPYSIYDVGFQLSYVSTFGILWGLPIFLRKIQFGPLAFRTAIMITIAATAFSFPLSIYYFNQYSLLSVFANFIIVPLISFVVLPLGYISLLLSLIYTGFGYVSARLSNTVLEGIYRAIEWGASIDMMHFVWKSPSYLWITFYYTLLISGLYLIDSKSSKSLDPNLAIAWKRQSALRWTDPPRLGVMLFIACTVLVGWEYTASSNGKAVRVTFLDVGQGDSIVIETPGGRTILIDGGGRLDFTSMKTEVWQRRRDPFEVGKDVVVPYLKYRGIKRIDEIVSTHGDLDHLGGLSAVVSFYHANGVIVNGDQLESDREKEWMRLVAEKGIPVFRAEAGRVWNIENQVKMYFLYPSEQTPNSLQGNNRSIVVVLEAYGKRFLLAGDIEAAAEGSLLALMKEHRLPAFTQIDVIKVSHHGSKTSTTEAWLTQFRPSIAVISVGKNNRFGHPTQEVLDRLADYKVQVYRTDKQGAITFLIDPNRMSVSSMIDE